MDRRTQPGNEPTTKEASQLGLPAVEPAGRVPLTDDATDPAAGRRIHHRGKRLAAPSLISSTIAYLKSLQRSDGYWWFSLEANETIGAEFVMLMRYLGEHDPQIEQGIARRILDVQRADGSWALYHDGPADLSTTVECYFALKIAGMEVSDPRMQRARAKILELGGAEKARVFTRIHLAMFGLMPWEAAPAMPAEFIFLPSWFYVSIYSFSSWARATIVPLLIFMSKKKVERLPDNFSLDEIFAAPEGERDFSFKAPSFLSIENFFIQIDRLLKIYEKRPLKRIREKALRRCSDWIWERVQKCEDIYPPLAYCAFAHRALGLAAEDPRIRRPFNALKMFQQRYASRDVPALPEEIRDNGRTRPSELRETGIDPRVLNGCHCEHSPAEYSAGRSEAIPCDRGIAASPGAECLERPAPRDDNGGFSIHQQCCISPVWDTPWMLEALLEAGLSPSDPALIKAGRWLLLKQVTDVRGDWAVRNRRAQPGGWSFEFENDYYPDVDDTIQVLTVLCRLAIPWRDKEQAVMRGMDWLLSMQNDDGGWGAFDRNQNRNLVNRIPFSDHKACLDPSSPDITGRMIEFLMRRNWSPQHPAVKRGLAYLNRTQEGFGGWFARWGINYIYGTWCALTALASAGVSPSDTRVSRAVEWLLSIQRPDGGFSEAPETYREGSGFAGYPESVPSQSAWALMALTAGGAAKSGAAARAATYLLESRDKNGAWEEMHYTGTGFPLHFYIRYHGYRHYFPLLALARYFRAGGACRPTDPA